MENKGSLLRPLLAIPIICIVTIIEVFLDGWIINKAYDLWLLSIVQIPLSYSDFIGIGIFFSIFCYLMRPLKDKQDQNDDYLEVFVATQTGKYIGVIIALFLYTIIWGFIV